MREARGPGGTENVVGFAKRVWRAGILQPLAKAGLWLVGGVVALLLITQFANPFADDTPRSAQITPEGTAPSVAVPAPTTSDPPLPPGFPVLDFPPKMPSVPKGAPQPVPTRLGLSYSVPGTDDWRPSNDGIQGWNDDAGRITTLGASSRYGLGYCKDDEKSWLAVVGVTGRNGVDLTSAAKTEVAKSERIFSNDAGDRPKVNISEPIQSTIGGRPAIRYSATVTDIPPGDRCQSKFAQLDVLATEAFASSPVMVMVVVRKMRVDGALADDDITALFDSIRRYN